MDPIAVILPTVLVAIALAAPRYGVDSRPAPPGEEARPLQRPSTLSGDVVTLLRRLRQAWRLAFHSH